MSKKGLKFGIASAAVIGAGAAVLQAKNKSEAKKAAETTTVTSEPKNDYRNTERGKYEKNSKGIYYTNGNYEAFARPEKPEGVDNKNAYLVGSGLASLAAACFLVRDGQMPGTGSSWDRAYLTSNTRPVRMHRAFPGKGCYGTDPTGTRSGFPSHVHHA